MRINGANCAVAFVFLREIVCRRPDSIGRRRSWSAAAKSPSFDVLIGLFHVQTRVVGPRRNIEQSRLRTIGRVIPISAPLVSRQDQCALWRGHHAGNSLRTPLFIEAAGPIHLDKRFAEQELSGCAIEHVEEPIAVCPKHDFARTALPLHIRKHGNLGGVVVELVVRRELVVPLQLAGIGVERDHGAAVQIVAIAFVAVPVWSWISNTPIGEIQIRIVGTRDPNRGAAMFPRVSVRRPGLVSGFTGTRNGVEAPNFLPGFGIVGGEKAADAVFAAGSSHNDFVFHDEWSQRHRITGLRLCNSDVPQRPAALCIDCDQSSIDGRHEQRVAQDRKTAIHSPAAWPCSLIGSMRVSPEQPPGRSIEGDDVVWSLNGIHDPVHDQWRSFELFERSGLEDPLHFQVFHILCGDLGKGAVSLAVVIAVMGQPVLRFLGGTKNAVVGNLCVQRTRGGEYGEQHIADIDESHQLACPFREAR